MDKKSLRAQLRAAMRALPESVRARSDGDIFARVSSLPEFQSAKRIFAYYSVGQEVDTHRLIARALEQGKTVALPVVLGGGVMEYARFERNGALDAGALAIPEPGPDALRLTPGPGDLVLVPALCFDREKYRLGQGGGYYDRALAACPAVTVGLARETLLLPQVPREAHDLPVDILVTESQVLR